MSRFSCTSLIAATVFAAVLGFPVPAMHAWNFSEAAHQTAPEAAPGWATLPEGSRSVFVGVHGGTAFVSLHPRADGTLFAVPGGTGRDFARHIKGKSGLPHAATAPSIAFWLRDPLRTVFDSELLAGETVNQDPRHSTTPLPLRFPATARFDDDDA